MGKDSASVLSNFKAAVEHLAGGSSASVEQGLGEVASALDALKDAMSQVGAAKHQVDDLAKAIEMFRDSEKIIYHVGTDLIVNGKNILFRIENAVNDFQNQQWTGFGESIGIIISDLLTPEAPKQPAPSQNFWPFTTCCQVLPTEADA